MSTLGEKIHQLRITNDGVALKATITNIQSISSFKKGWIGADYLYETPNLFINCDTKFGPIQLQSEFNTLSESGLKPLLTKTDAFDIEKETELEALYDKTIFIAPNEEASNATVGWTQDVEYTDNNTVTLKHESDRRQLDDFEVQKTQLATGIEPRKTKWMNDLITTEYHREEYGNNGWMQVPFEYTAEIDDAYFFTATLPTGVKIYWTFENTITGIQDANTFLNILDIDYTPKEFESEEIWIKPLRSIHGSNIPDNHIQVDSEEFWVASNQPHKPTYNKTILDKIASFFALSTKDDRETSTGRPRRAKSSHTIESPTLKETAETKILE